MKKNFMFAVMTALMFMLTACNGCTFDGSDTTVPDTTADSVIDSVIGVDSTVVPEFVGLDFEKINVIDNDYMRNDYGDDYVWSESCVKYNYFMDEVNDVDKNQIVEMVNVFTIPGKYVTIFISHIGDEMNILKREGAIRYDRPLNKIDPVEYRFDKAYYLVIDGCKDVPHTKHCVLRWEKGINEYEPLFVFGNVRQQVYVDLFNGTTYLENPVFKGKEGYLITFTPDIFE